MLCWQYCAIPGCFINCYHQKFNSTFIRHHETVNDTVIVNANKIVSYVLCGGNLIYCFYRAMHCSAKRGLAVTCHLSIRMSVCLSVTLMDHDHIGWKSWKLISQTISPASLLFVAQGSSTYSQGNMEKFWGENVCSTPTSITSGWIESTESHVILVGGVAVCLLLSAHRAVIFAIAQFSCFLIHLPTSLKQIVVLTNVPYIVHLLI